MAFRGLKEAIRSGYASGWKSTSPPISEPPPSSTPEPEQPPDITQYNFEDDTTTMSESKSARPVSKRVSTAPSAPKPPATIDPSAILANHATVTGVFPITVGANVVLNPYSKVLSNAGPVEIGEGCVIWERAVVGINVEAGARDEDDDAGLGGTFVMLERNCVIESGAQVSAKIVGEGTVIEAFASVGEGCVIGKFCKILPHAVVPPNTVIEDFTIVSGLNKRRKDVTAISNPTVLDLRKIAHQKQLKTLQSLIPSNLAKWLA